MAGWRLVYRTHALRRMLERNISADDVRWVLETGVTIAEYPGDRPIPSRLVLGWVLDRPIHVVAADLENSEITVVITAYQPDPDAWYRGFRLRRQ